MRLRGVVVAAMALTLSCARGQQAADDAADTAVRNPRFEMGTGPVVAIDSGHNNYHTATGRYAPFASLLRHDGLKVTDNPGRFSVSSLKWVRLLVVADAMRTPEAEIKDWNAPQPSALASDEVHTLVGWVRQGGSLLIIADHRPFAGSIEALASAFGFTFADELARRSQQTGMPDIFSTDSGTLKDDEILTGRDARERVTAVQTFSGSAFRIPPAAKPIIILPHGYNLVSCGLPCPVGATERPADGFYQGAVLRLGLGKVAVFGEAAMFSAQTVQAGGQTYYAGFNAPTAKQNKQFVLNLERWLVSPSAHAK